VTENLADAAQTRMIAEAVARATIIEFQKEYPEATRHPEVTIPPPLKWAAGIIAALFTTGVASLALWLVVTVSNVQVMLARMDERMIGSDTALNSRFDDINRRVGRLEAYHGLEKN